MCVVFQVVFLPIKRTSLSASTRHRVAAQRRSLRSGKNLSSFTSAPTRQRTGADSSRLRAAESEKVRRSARMVREERALNVTDAGGFLLPRPGGAGTERRRKSHRVV